MNQESENQNETVIYIGTQKIVALEGSLSGSEPVVTRHFILKNPEGFEKGFVSNLAQAAASIEAVLNGLYKNAKPEDLSCYVILGNPKLKTYGYSSSQYYQGFQRTITTQEIRQVVNQTRSVATLPLSEGILATAGTAIVLYALAPRHEDFVILCSRCMQWTSRALKDLGYCPRGSPTEFFAPIKPKTPPNEDEKPEQKEDKGSDTPASADQRPSGHRTLSSRFLKKKRSSDN